MINPKLFNPEPGVDYRHLTGGRDIQLYRIGHEAHANIRQSAVYHSPDGFEWGYGGSGPADLALNILLQFVALPEAWRLHQQYKWDVIARLEQEGPHIISAESVKQWIREQWAKEPI